MERRRSKRWINEEEVLCYFQGDRLGAYSKDLSSTGMFVGTTMDVRIQGRVALIFRQRYARDNPIYLVGEVARRQVDPVPGLGIRWVKAITDASPPQLKKFLKEVIQVDAGDAIEETDQDYGAVSSFIFPTARPVGSEKRSKKKSVLELLDMLNVDASKPNDHGDTGGQRGQRVATRPTEPAPAPEPEPAVSGPITLRVDNQKVYGPCRIPGTLVIDAAQTESMIRGLATWGLFVETEAKPQVGSEVGLIFDLRTKSGDARLVLRCEVAAHKPAKEGWSAGLGLTITDPGDPLGEALLKRYVRWLHFRAVADD